MIGGERLQRTAALAASLKLIPFSVHLYAGSELLTELLIYFALLLGPWAYGTTQNWSIWLLNIVGFCLWVLLGIKILVRHFGVGIYERTRWAEIKRDWSAGALAILTLLLLSYCLTNAINAGAIFNEQTLSFDFLPHISFLPHSFDRFASWQAFFRYLGLAGAFWGIWDWLGGKTGSELIGSRSSGALLASRGTWIPARALRLICLLAVNGGLLALESAVQRWSGTSKLIFLLEPRIHKTAAEQFGPYAYRANAAQYFNLLWPLCFGLWLIAAPSEEPWNKRRPVLLFATVVMAVGAVMSGSRGGAMVMLGMAACGFFMLISWKGAGALPDEKTQWRKALFCLGVAVVLGFIVGWNVLGHRFLHVSEDFTVRQQIYDAAKVIALDYPIFGTGPGTFETVSQLYPRPEIFWPAQAHNDWLETRITFGLAGSFLIALAFFIVVARWFMPGQMVTGVQFMGWLWLPMAGCLVHARFDFPFQVHSVSFLFIVLCALAFRFSRQAE